MAKKIFLVIADDPSKIAMKDFRFLLEAAPKELFMGVETKKYGHLLLLSGGLWRIVIYDNDRCSFGAFAKDIREWEDIFATITDCVLLTNKYVSEEFKAICESMGVIIYSHNHVEISPV